MTHNWRILSDSLQWCEDCGAIKHTHEDHDKIIIPRFGVNVNYGSSWRSKVEYKGAQHETKGLK